MPILAAVRGQLSLWDILKAQVANLR